MRARSSALLMSFGLTVGVLAVATAPACNRANPNFHPGASPTGAAGADAGPAGQAGATGSSGATGATDAGTGAVDGGADATLGSCKQAGDCLVARGAPPCGSWVCRAAQCAVMCASCTDNDNDGYGVGAGCAGPDCDDNDPTIGKTGTRACYEGKGGTLGIGACRAGTQLCSEGVWSTTCTGQILPTGEACNGLDDDCNGKADDGLGTISCGLGVCAATAPACANGVLGVCQPGAPTALVDTCDGKDDNCNGAVDESCVLACVHVGPNGDDMMGLGTSLRPFRSIQAAIDFAAAVAERPKAICVAGGDTCLDTNTYETPDNGTFTMANGVSVYGNYEARTWTRCPFGATGLPNLTVTLTPRSAVGVSFPATVTTPTTIDGVRITRFAAGGGGGGATTPTAGITVTGAKQVTISNVVIDEAESGTTSYGVNLTGGAEALITRSAIFGGGASVSAIGIHSVGSKPTIRENCATIDATTGHCTALCSPTSLGIHGRYAPMMMMGGGGGVMGNATVEGVGIDLVDSPGAVVERSAICGTEATEGDGVRISGASAGTVVRGNSITADGGTTDALGISLLACADASPWIVDNELIVGSASGTAARAAGINVVGACHPVIDRNTKIAAGETGAPQSAFGIFCGADAAGPSRCTVMGNKLVQGSPTVHPAESYAVACDVGACARISGNTLIGQSGGTVVGLSLTATGAFVDRNVITGGCGSKTTTAVLIQDAFARLENNVVHGAACDPTLSTPEADGVRVHVALSGNEVDVSSNTIDAGGVGQCQGVAAGIGLGNMAGPKTSHGIFRDNILRAGACTIGRVDFIETEAGTTPRIFSHNDLDPTGAPMLYLRTTPPIPTTIDDVNNLTGSSGNISVDPKFVSATDFHLSAGSACIDAGTTVGAPKTDFDGKARDAKPDIGAYEH